MTTTLKTTTPAKRNTARAKAFSLTAFIAEGIAARIALPFYKHALAYHKKAKTVFPRPRLDETRKALTKADVEAVFTKADKGILPSGDHKAQACFDVYMLSLKK